MYFMLFACWLHIGDYINNLIVNLGANKLIVNLSADNTTIICSATKINQTFLLHSTAAI